MIRYIKNRLWLIRRLLLLKIRGRVHHSDRFGLSYWLWENTRAMGTPSGEPRTDDTGVLEQLRRVYEAIGQPDGRQVVSVDAGTYIGVISLAMFRFGPVNHVVHSFEADDINYSRLDQNVSGLPGGSVVIHKTAVSNHVGTAEFTRNRDPGTNSLIGGLGDSASPTAVYTVPVTTLDTFVEEQGLDGIDVLKIDVEGADLEVLLGASSLLSSGRIKAIVVEIPLTSVRRAEMNELLVGYGLRLAYIVRNSTDLIPAGEVSYAGSPRAPLNMLAAKTDLANRLEVGL